MIDLLKNNKNFKVRGSDLATNEEKITDQQIGSDETESIAVDIERYKDPQGLTVGRMQFGLWVVANRSNFKFILIAVLFLVIFFCWGLYIYTFGRQVAIGIKEDHGMMVGLMNPDLIDIDDVLKHSAKELSYGQIGAIKAMGDDIDFYGKVLNPNDKYSAHFDFYFEIGEEKSELESGFVLPGETKILLLLSQKINTSFANPKLVVKNIDWRHIDYTKFTDWTKFAEEHLRIGISDIDFTPAIQSNLSEQIDINTLDFSAHNDTAYNYWSITFNVLLYNNNDVIGVNRYAANRFMSGETRKIGITWPEDVKRVTNIAVLPEIDITRDDIYISYDGGTGDVK